MIFVAQQKNERDTGNGHGPKIGTCLSISGLICKHFANSAKVLHYAICIADKELTQIEDLQLWRDRILS